MVVVCDRVPTFRMTAYNCKSPVIQSLLTQMLNGLGVAKMYSLLPKPQYGSPALFEIV